LIDWNLIRKLLGMSACKEGAVVAVGETPLQRKKTSHGKDDMTNCRRCKHSPQEKRKMIYH
jgi:hypothetical protein